MHNAFLTSTQNARCVADVPEAWVNSGKLMNLHDSVTYDKAQPECVQSHAPVRLQRCACADGLFVTTKAWLLHQQPYSIVHQPQEWAETEKTNPPAMFLHAKRCQDHNRNSASALGSSTQERSIPAPPPGSSNLVHRRQQTRLCYKLLSSRVKPKASSIFSHLHWP